MSFLNAIFSRNRDGKRKRRLEIQSGNIRFSEDGHASVHKIDDSRNLVIGPDGMKIEQNVGNARFNYGGTPNNTTGSIAFQSHRQPKSYSQAINHPSSSPTDPCRFARHDFSQPFNLPTNEDNNDNPFASDNP